MEYLIDIGALKTPEIIEAFRSVDRKDFVPEKFKYLAYEDEALPLGQSPDGTIGAWQTISQPFTVAFMLELLQPKAGDKIMDIGSGSMWQTAILAEIVGARNSPEAEAGEIYAIEINEEIFRFGQSNIAKYPELEERVTSFCQNADRGLEDIAEIIGGFDSITAAAQLEEAPEAWREQLKIGGTLIYPKNGSIFREFKKSKTRFEVSNFPGFAFVPFVD